MPRHAVEDMPSPHYLAAPRHGSGPGVLVLHSWWGLNRCFKDLCDRLAEAGFVALAPDLFDGKVASTEADARRLRAAATASRREPAYKLLMRAIDALSRHEAVASPRIGIVGFSMGGHWAIWLAQRPALPVAASVVLYAARNGDFTQSKSAFQFHLAEHDRWVSQASLKKMTASLASAGRPAEFFTYPGTHHWFFEQDRRDVFDPDAAALAWQRTINFLRQRLADHPRG